MTVSKTVGGSSNLSSRARKNVLKMRFINYAKNAYTELVQKVSWPSWSQLSNSAVIVMIASLLIAVVVLVMDIAFENLMKAIYNILY